MNPHPENAKLAGLRTPRCRRHSTTFAFLMLIWCMGIGLAQANAFGLQMREDTGTWQDALAMDTSIEVEVNGMVARVVVSQSYRNDTARWQEGRYQLPLPSQAAVDQLRIRIGQRLIEGEVQEKQQARQTYETAVAQGQRAALVEQDRPNLFRTAVANIGPGEDVTLEIGFLMRVDYRDGGFGLVLPLTVTPRYHGQRSDQDIPLQGAGTPAPAATRVTEALEPTVSLTARIIPGMPLEALTSSSHHIHVEDNGWFQRVRFEDYVEQSDRDIALAWRPVPSTEPQQAVFTESIGGETYALLMLLPPTQKTSPLPRELILLLDNSGSMRGTPMQQAIAATDLALARLRPDDYFNVVRFDHTRERVFPGSVPASAANVAQARRFVQALRAIGGTEIGPALDLALKPAPLPGYLRQVVLVTDAAIDNENALLAQIERDLGQARLFTVGIGSAPNEYFIRRAAEGGRGSFELIRDIHEVQERMASLLARIDQPLLQNIALQWPVAAESYPQRIPDLYAGEPLVVFSRLDRLQGDLLVRGGMRKGAWQARLPLTLGKYNAGDGIAKLWARARLTDLADQLRRGADAEDIRKLSLEVALQHGLASAYTSFVAVEKTPMRDPAAELVSTRINNATPAGSLAMAQGGTDAGRLLVIGLLLLLSAVIALPRRTRGRPSFQA